MLKELILKDYNEDILNEILEGYNSNRYTTFRVNILKSTLEEVLDVLRTNNIEYEMSTIYENGIILKSDYDIRSLDIYKNGKIYIQSLSSMLPPLYMDLNENDSVLDMTAAPGGKTSLMASLANIKITALEKNKIRCDRLKYNLDKLGVKRCTIMNVDARLLDNLFKFDRILLDAPCSGTGTLNKNDYENFDVELVDRSVKIQEILLNKAIDVLKVGGTIVYSTCSILKEENELQIEKVLKKGNVKIVPLDSKDLLVLPSLMGTICVKPTQYYEGFFIAKLEKIK